MARFKSELYRRTLGRPENLAGYAVTHNRTTMTDILNPIPGGIGQTFMPAERMTAGEKAWTASNTNFEGGMGIDATVPYGYEGDFHRPVYPVDRVKPEDFFNAKDIEKMKSRMAGWVLSLARPRGGPSRPQQTGRAGG